MGTMQIGQIGLSVTITEIIDWEYRSGPRTGLPTFTVTGNIVKTALADALYLRDELLALADAHRLDVGLAVPMLWSPDPTMNSFFRIVDVRITGKKMAADFHILPFSMTIEDVGNEAGMEFQSLLHVITISNDYGFVDADVEASHAPPVNAMPYYTGDDAPSIHERATEDGIIQVAIGLDPDTDPRWAGRPADFHKGAVRIEVANPLEAGTPLRRRSGIKVPLNPDVWRLSNGICRCTPGLTSLISNGRLLFSWWNGTAWSTPIGFKILFGGVTVVPNWSFSSVVKNAPHCGITTLVREANEVEETTNKHHLNLTLRRGMPFVQGFYDFSSGIPTDWAVAVDTPEAATAVTIGANNVGIRASAATDGNRWVIGTSQTHVANLTTGVITFAAVTEFDFFIGAEIGGASAPANDQAADLVSQYLADVAEQTRAIPR